MTAASLLLGILAPASTALAAGELDASFDGDGKLITDLGGNDAANDVVVQSDGRIVAVGRALGISQVALLRYNPNGSLDTSFDGDGKVLTDIAGAAVELQTDGKIVTAGRSPTTNDFALARYNVDGTLDTSFDGDGIAVTDFGGDSSAVALAIAADGKLIAAGSSVDTGGEDYVAVARYNPGGTLDTSFDGDGKVLSDFAFFEGATGVAVQSDGKVVVTNDICGCDPFTPDRSFVLRYNTGGSLDTSFDGDGRAALGNGTSANAVAVQGDGKIVVIGKEVGDFLVVRYNPNGSLDTSFDGDGRAVTDFGDNDFANDVAIQPDGKIIAAGGNNQFQIARYNPSGSLDLDFDGDGKVVTDFGGIDASHGVALAPGGKIVAAGLSDGASSDFNFALARYFGMNPPTISINDVAKLEGNAGLTSSTFTVSLSMPSSDGITVSRQTVNGSASAPSDYTALNPATIIFLPGQTTKTVTVKVKGEVAIEPSETFFINLSNATNATIADGQGKGTITNDDLSPSAACTIRGTNRDDVINGTSGNDVICGRKGNDQIYGLDGNDVLKGEDGNDLVVGGNGADLLLGAIGADVLRGFAGNDTARGGDDADMISGAAGSDALFGELGGDSLNTQDGVSANDSADGGADSDSCVFDSGDFVTNCP